MLLLPQIKMLIHSKLKRLVASAESDWLALPQGPCLVKWTAAAAHPTQRWVGNAWNRCIAAHGYRGAAAALPGKRTNIKNRIHLTATDAHITLRSGDLLTDWSTRGLQINKNAIVKQLYVKLRMNISLNWMTTNWFVCKSSGKPKKFTAPVNLILQHQTLFSQVLFTATENGEIGFVVRSRLICYYFLFRKTASPNLYIHPTYDIVYYM